MPRFMRAAAKEHAWNLNYGGVALMWRGGCIIRSVFLGKIKEAFDRDRAAFERWKREDGFRVTEAIRARIEAV